MLCLSGRLIDEMRCGADVETPPGELDNKQITRLHQLLHEAKFKEPDGSHLSPAGLPPPALLPLMNTPCMHSEAPTFHTLMGLDKQLTKSNGYCTLACSDLSSCCSSQCGLEWVP